MTFAVFTMYKRNSRYYLTEIGNPFLKKQMKKKSEAENALQEDKAELTLVRRMSSLFTEILDSMVSFVCSFLKTLPIEESNKASDQLFSLLFEGEKIV